MNILNTIKNYNNNTTLIMYQVVLCLLPGIGTMVWLFGINVLVQIVLSVLTVLICETIIMRLRKRPILTNIFDGSGILTAILLAISIPPIAPWWLIIIGSSFAILFGKQLYGGLGNNIFNPAMLGFVMLIISFPKQMTVWSSIDFYLTLTTLEQIKLIFIEPINLDAITAATPLAGLNTALGQGGSVSGFLNQTSLINWSFINGAFLFGGIILWLRNLISWQIPTAFLFSLALMSLIFNTINPAVFAPVSFHLFMGATMLGAFFIATDPVSASTTAKGRLIYGLGLGGIIFIIRSFGSFHDAIAFSVLFMNMLVPLIDAYSKPKPFGINKRHPK